MLNIAHYQRNADQNYNELPHTSQNGHHQKNLQIINAGEGVEKRKPTCTVGGNVNSYSHYGEQYIVVQSLSCVRLVVTPLDCSLPGSSVHGILQARILEWVAISFSSFLRRVLKKLGIKLPYDPTILLLGIYSKKTVIEKNTHPSVHCSTIYKSQDMEETQIPINR